MPCMVSSLLHLFPFAGAFSIHFPATPSHPTGAPRIQDFPAYVDMACLHMFVLVNMKAFTNGLTVFLSVSCFLSFHLVADKLLWASALDFSFIGNLLALFLSSGCLPCSQPAGGQLLKITLIKVTSNFPFLVPNFCIWVQSGHITHDPELGAVLC